MTRVERVELPLLALGARILAVCGKDRGRVAAILAGGSLVSGDARYRWAPIVASPADIAGLLERFPDHDPTRELVAARCTRIVLRGVRGDVEITPEIGRRRLFRRRNFWDEALPILAGLSPRCERYSYSDASDVFVATLTPGALESLRKIAPLLRYSSLQDAVRYTLAGPVMLYASR